MASGVLDHRSHDTRSSLAGIREQPRVVIGRAAEHDAVDLAPLAFNLRTGGDAAVDDDLELREFALQPIDVVVLERRYLAVLLRRQSLEDRIARVDDEGAAAGFSDRADEIAHEVVFLDLVDADAMLDRHRDCHFRSYAGHTRRDQLRLRHQAGAESAALHALARAADV